MEITSLNNKKVKEWCMLQNKKERDKTQKFLIESEHLVQEALATWGVEEIIATNESFKVEGIPFYLVNEAVMRKISMQNSSSKVVAVCKMLASREVRGKVCILDDIQDPGNLGTIIRSAVAFNIDTIIASLNTVSLYNPKVVRATEGMMFKVNYIVGDIKEKIAELKKDGYTIYGSDVVKGEDIASIDYSLKSAIVIGNEGQGISDSIKNSCDNLIHIPINSQVESLNASVAASIMFYELNRG